MQQTLSLLLVAFLVVACSGGDSDDDSSASDASTSDAALSPADAAPQHSPDLGKNCPMGCNLTLCVSTTSDSCENRFCVWDGRFGFDSYCSEPCEEGTCPAGWQCLVADDGEGSFCFANPAECGNGIVERGETCDPGPDTGSPQSGCSSDCDETISGGSVSYEWDGTPRQLSGTSEDGSVHANVDDPFVNISFSSAYSYSLDLRIRLDDLQGPFPKAVSSHVSFSYYQPTACFHNPGLGQYEDVVVIEEWDPGVRISGSFDGVFDYVRCCSFCTDPELRQHTVSGSHFDVVLKPQP
jgi:hypothetical protein